LRSDFYSELKEEVFYADEDLLTPTHADGMVLNEAVADCGDAPGR
jgi:hypothetical protein